MAFSCDLDKTEIKHVGVCYGEGVSVRKIPGLLVKGGDIYVYLGSLLYSPLLLSRFFFSNFIPYPLLYLISIYLLLFCCILLSLHSSPY
jgi:hypothetical protein